jgi:hypothetical protein
VAVTSPGPKPTTIETKSSLNLSQQDELYKYRQEMAQEMRRINQVCSQASKQAYIHTWQLAIGMDWI